MQEQAGTDGFFFSQGRTKMHKILVYDANFSGI